MRLSRLSTISVVYGLKEKFHDEGFSTDSALTSGFSYIPIGSKDNQYDALESPKIVVYISNITDKELQLGGGFWVRPVLNFDVYASTDGMLYDMVDIVREFIESPIHIRRYDLSPPSYQVSGGLVRTYYENGNPVEVCLAHTESRVVTFVPRLDTIGESTAHKAQITSIVAIPNI